MSDCEINVGDIVRHKHRVHIPPLKVIALHEGDAWVQETEDPRVKYIAHTSNLVPTPSPDEPVKVTVVLTPDQQNQLKEGRNVMACLNKPIEAECNSPLYDCHTIYLDCMGVDELWEKHRIHLLRDLEGGVRVRRRTNRHELCLNADGDWGRIYSHSKNLGDYSSALLAATQAAKRLQEEDR